MNALKEELINIIRFITFNPDNTPEMIGLGIVALLAALLTLHHVSIAMGSNMANRYRSIIIVLITTIPVILIIAAVNIYCVPKITNEAVRKWLPPALAAVLVSGIGIPTCKGINKIKWSSSSAVIILAAIAVWGSAILGSAAVGAIKATCKQLKDASEQMEERQQSIPR